MKTLELKDFQQAALSRLRSFLNKARLLNDPALAFE
jgi:hypothetical protein